MRVLFSSTRGTGHLEPLLPYAKALLAQGHEVLVAGPPDLREPLLKAGLDHAVFGHPGDEGLAPYWARVRGAPPEEANNVAVRDIFAGINSQVALPALLETVRSWRPQLVVRDSVEFASLVAAEVIHVPHARVAVHQRAVEENICSLVAEPIAALRQQAGLSAGNAVFLRGEPTFTSFPESFEGRSEHKDFSTPFRIGPKLLPTSASSEWEANGIELPLVYITFGTVATHVAEALAMYQTAIAAIAELPIRALLTTGRGFDVAKLGTLPTNLRVEAWVPQAEVLPHAAVLVCHGGSGTVLGALAAGVPQVVIPLFADQPQNAERIAAVGAGIGLTKPDVFTLAAAIQRILDGAEFRAAARAVAAEMATLPRVEAAVDAMLKLAAH